MSAAVIFMVVALLSFAVAIVVVLTIRIVRHYPDPNCPESDIQRWNDLGK